MKKFLILLLVLTINNLFASKAKEVPASLEKPEIFKQLCGKGIEFVPGGTLTGLSSAKAKAGTEQFNALRERISVLNNAKNLESDPKKVEELQILIDQAKAARKKLIQLLISAQAK